MTIIITACGPSETLENTLACLPVGQNVIVADAKATTENYEICDAYFAHYHARKMDGFAANVNYLLSQVKTEYVLLLGNDVMLLPTTLKCMYDNTAYNRIVQPVVLDTTPVKRPSARKGYTDKMAGNCTMLSMAFIQKHNLKFNESLFSYGEDTQFGFDWISHGGYILQLDNCYAVHDHRGYYNTTPAARKYYYLVRNSLHVARKYPKQWGLMGTMIALGCIALKPAYFGDTISGLVDFLAGTYGPHPDHKLC